jgi:3-isopropylmalate dehydrogenase
MLLRYSLGLEKPANAIEKAVQKALDTPEQGGYGLRTADLGGNVSTRELGDKIVEILGTLL